MNAELQPLWSWVGGLLPILLDGAIKGAALLAIAGLAVAAMRQASAAVRHWVWMLALSATLALLPLSLALPGWRVLPAWAAPGWASAAAGSPSTEGRGRQSSAGDAVPQPAATGAVPDDGQSVNPAVELTTPHGLAARSLSATAGMSWAVIAWAVGAIACLLPLAMGRLSLWRLARTARPITDGAWQALARQAADALRLRGNVLLLQSDTEPMPMVWGIFRHRVVLPREADHWTAQRRRVVLLHELAHVKRHDCLSKLVAHLACAAYWFNPLAWWAFKRMQNEAEGACDDRVLAAGHRPSEYATHLLEIASGLRAGMLVAWHSIAMAGKSTVDGRVRAILDEHRNRRLPTRGRLLIAAILVAGLAVPLAVLRTATADEPSPVVAEAPPNTATVPDKFMVQPGAQLPILRAGANAGAASAREPAAKAILVSIEVLMIDPKDDATLVKALRDRFLPDLTGLGDQALIIRDHADEMPGFLQDHKAKVLSRPQILVPDDMDASLAIGSWVPFSLPATVGKEGPEIVQASVGVKMSLRAYVQDGTALNVEFSNMEPCGEGKVGVAALSCVRQLPAGAALLLRVAAPGRIYRVTGATGGNRGADGIRNNVELVKQPLPEKGEPAGTYYVWIKPALLSDEALSAKTKEFIDLLRTGKFDEAARRSVEPPAKLSATWSDLEKRYGSCAGAGRMTPRYGFEAPGGLSSVLMQTSWQRFSAVGKEGRLVELKLTFDAAGKVIELAEVQPKRPATLPATVGPGRRVASPN